jgi:hypothetical protein
MNKIVQINALKFSKRVASVLLFGEFLQLGAFFFQKVNFFLKELSFLGIFLHIF